jgi:hypothetical protein
MHVRSVAKLMLAFSACLLCAVLIAVLALNNGVLSPRGLGIILALLCLGGIFIFTIAFQRMARKNAAEGSETRTSERTIMLSVLEWIKQHRIGVLVLSLWLVACFWLTRGGPWIPRLIGAFFALLFTIGWLSREKHVSTR